MKLYNMSEDSEFSKPNEVHLPQLPDTVTAAEYERAVERLRQFAEADISSVSDLEGTIQVTDRYRVGLSLRAIAITHGRSREGAYIATVSGREGESGIKLPGYSLIRTVGHSQMALSLSTYPHDFTILQDVIISGINYDPSDIQYCNFTSQDLSSEQFLKDRYDVNIPATRSIDDLPFLPKNTIFAVELKTLQLTPGDPVQPEQQVVIRFNPVDHPKSYGQQQGYLGYLQRAAKDVLSLNLPPPTSISSAFTTS